MNSEKNINSREYWDQRFGTEDWERKQGREQTEGFARAQCPLFELAADFRGRLTDFGCGLGDAIPVYKEFFPHATIAGTDLSVAAIDKCTQRFGNIAEFFSGDHLSVPVSDVIVASNVFEHLSNDSVVAGALAAKCRLLFIVVPFKEKIFPGQEHVNSYDLDSFSHLPVERTVVFPSPGWSEYGIRLLVRVYFANIFRALTFRPLKRRSMQVLFQIRGTL